MWQPTEGDYPVPVPVDWSKEDVWCPAARDYPVPVSMPADWRKENSLAMIATEGGEALASVSAELRADRELVLAAVSQNGLSLQFAAEACWDDKAIVMQAVLQNGEALQFASWRLRSDRDVVEQALYGEHYARSVPRYFPKFITPVMDVMQSSRAADYSVRWPVLRFASPALRDDRSFMMKEVSHMGFQLQFASEKLRKDKQLVLKAVQSVGVSFHFADEALKKDRAFVMEVVQISGDAFECCDWGFRSDREVAMTAFRHASLPIILRKGNENLMQDERFIKELQPYLTNCLGCLVLQVSLLSGRSCFLFLTDSPVEKWRLSQVALRMLGMDESLHPCAELVRGNVPLPPFFDVFRELSNGRIVELTLIITRG
mmetsp:Transcript_48584/g.115461  ORF Transcript_48584/g.115461 Transcript_48584/m.115461 type:complete len:373 (+) Transcript_48584:164-1282(+)